MPINDYKLHSVGVDVGFGSSNSAIVLTEFLKEVSYMRKNSKMAIRRILSTSVLIFIESITIHGSLLMVPIGHL